MKDFLFLDFDGVICNSLEECLVTAWKGYYQYHKKQTIPPATPKAREQFLSQRIYIRAGMDYMAILRMMEEGISCRSQKEFDNYIEALGPEKMEYYKEHFYKARQELLENEFEYWCSLNPLYPHMKELLPRYISSQRLYILSTKMPLYIIAILKYHGMEIEEERVLYSSKEPKYTVIGRILDKYPDSQAYFVDDQIDHFKIRQDERIHPYLAAWGFINPDWLKEGIPVLEAVDTKEILSRL